MEIRRGTLFNTPYETNCRVVTLPDEHGNFDAIDSDGVLCGFHLVLVCGANHPKHGGIDKDHECVPYQQMHQEDTQPEQMEQNQHNQEEKDKPANE